jgi:hypothetical protein
MELKISRTVVLPTKAVTSKLAFIGQSGSGKTYAAGKFAEECLELGAQTVVIDNVGIWWGLRLAANGKSPGISIPVFGGDHADAPLNPDSGVFMAQVVAEKKFSCILDVSDFTEGEKHRWTEAFAKEFLHQKKRHKSAVMLIWEEAHEFVPEFAPKDEARMLGAMQRLIKKGRNYGVGTALISQQPQSVSKSVLNQTEILFAFKANGKHERKAIKDWVVYNHVENAVESAVEALPELEAGECFIWSPTMLKVFERIKISKKWTFDASATPEFDEDEQTTGKLAKVDLAKISKEMQALVNKTKEENPELLKKRIVELEKELEMARKKAATQVRVITEKDIKDLERVLDRAGQVLVPVMFALRDVGTKLASVGYTGKLPETAVTEALVPTPVPPPVSQQNHRPVPVIAKRLKKTPIDGEVKLVGKSVEILRILAVCGPMTRSALAVKAVINPSGTYSTYLSALRSAEYIVDVGDGLIGITESGLAWIRERLGNNLGSKPSKQQLIEQWKQYHLVGKSKDMIDAVAELGDVNRETLAQTIGMEMSGTFSTYLSSIMSAGLFEKKGRAYVLSEAFGR